MFRRLFWLGTIAGIGYLIWRWARQQNEAPPHAGTTTPHLASAPPVAPESLATPTGEPSAAPAGPRRIPTRVHRGAPPSEALRAKTLAAGEAPATPAAEPEPAADQPTNTPGAAQEDVPAEPEPGVAQAEQPEAMAELGPGVAQAEQPEAPTEAGPDDTSPEPALTNINTADEETLVALPGIGPALARRIIAYRDEHGPFATIEDLATIQGIGPRNIDEFRHLVTV